MCVKVTSDMQYDLCYENCNFILNSEIIYKMILDVSIILICLVIKEMVNYYLNFVFWSKRNVKGPKPIPFIGNYWSCLRGKDHPVELAKKIYDNFKDEPMVGYFIQNKPVLLLRDLELIQDVLTKDGSVFSDRGICIDDRIEPMANHLYNLSDNTCWHPLRKNLLLAFTPSKIKDMFDTMVKIAEKLKKCIEDKVDNSNNLLESIALTRKYAIEIVRDCGFSSTVDINEVVKINSKRQKNKLYNFIRRYSRVYCPTLYTFFHYNNKEKTEFYVNFIKNVINYRKIHKIDKNDYIGILKTILDNPQIINKQETSDTFLGAQAYVFLTAGVDSIAMILSNAFYELAKNQAIQKKLREQIKGINLDNANLTFDGIKNMNYLDWIFKETNRKYPLRNLIRKCNSTYKFSNKNITIPENIQVIISNYAIHRDSKFFPNPDEFQPERFDPNRKDIEHPSMAYLPFGEGQRQCIGARFGEIASKIAIIIIVKNFKLELTGEECIRRENDPRNVILSPIGGIYIRFNKI